MVANGMEILTFLIQGVFAQGFTLLVRTCAFFRNCRFLCVVLRWLGIETHGERERARARGRERQKDSERARERARERESRREGAGERV